jgi:hypothetical protein
MPFPIIVDVFPVFQTISLYMFMQNPLFITNVKIMATVSVGQLP